MKALIVSGIWPPDVGGPASHAPEVAEFLRARGNEVRAVVSADREPARAEYPVDWISRASPVRHVRAVLKIAMLARRADVVYSTGMIGRTGVACLLARKPYVLKVAGDPAFERARRLHLTSSEVEAFQTELSPATLPLRILRNAIIRRAAHVVTPSAFLRELAIGWGAPEVTVLPNPAPDVPQTPPRDELRARFGMTGPTLVFAGRLAPQKSLDVGIEAARRAGVPLLIAGDGPERARLEALGHAQFLGPLPRSGVLELFRAGDASLLSSSWENFPHSVVESLAAGTPLVATDVGGVGEVVRDGVNGLLVPPNDVDALAAAITRIFGEPGLLESLHADAVASVLQYSRDQVYGRLLDILVAAR
jgi:glycosyltransferase involved in cell wall biosynthesis